MDYQIKENLVGRLGNFPLSVEKPLWPVFEAISNSIHAVDDSKRTDGQISVHIHRNPSQTIAMAEEMRPVEVVSGFTIEDNGIGFTEANFSSFCTADSTQKKARGGKGVGRLSWLKVFERAEVESVYQLTPTRRQLRRFTFTLSEKPIADYTVNDTDAEISTVVRLIGFRPEYQKYCPKQYETIARKLIEHFMALLVHSTCPSIMLVDESETTEQSLNRIFDNQIRQFSKTEKLRVHGCDLQLQHFRIATRSPQPDHTLHFCALTPPQHLAKYSLHATASAIVLLVDASK